MCVSDYEPPRIIQHHDPSRSPCRTFSARTVIPVSAEALFHWHEQPGAFQRLTPPWEPVRLISHTGGIQNGGRAELEVQIGLLRKQWIAVHENYDPPRQFQDRQITGPFAEFVHTHRMHARDDGTSELEDSIQYRLPGGRLGDWLGQRLVARKLARLFQYRHHITYHDLLASTQITEHQPMKILVTGATGLVGTELTTFLKMAGHDVYRLTRRNPTDANDIPWNPATGNIPKARLENLDAVIHLAGENIAEARWTNAFKEKMRFSRVNATRLLCETLAQLQSPPKTFLCASAIGYYGNRGAEKMTESSPPGTGFLADLCRDWEAATEPLNNLEMRLVHTRIGVVLSTRGGALKKMLTPFSCGVGGIVGDGKQYWSWVALDDVVGALAHCLTHAEIAGPVNVVSPNPSTNYDFTKTLGSVLHRPTIFPMPAFAARLLLGEMAEDLLLSSTRVIPTRLLETGYTFRCPTLESAFNHTLGK